MWIRLLGPSAPAKYVQNHVFLRVGARKRKPGFAGPFWKSALPLEFLRAFGPSGYVHSGRRTSNLALYGPFGPELSNHYFLCAFGPLEPKVTYFYMLWGPQSLQILTFCVHLGPWGPKSRIFTCIWAPKAT